jgi:hypothetical protein
LDTEFLALSVVMMVMGGVGIVLFSSVFYNGSFTPVMTPPGDGCYCPISSPEPSAGQGTSSILLAVGVLFFPMGLMKGGMPSFGKGLVKGTPVAGPGGKMVTPVQISSGGLLTFGIVLLLIGVDALLIPGFLVFRSAPIAIAGIVLAGIGFLVAFMGIGKPKGA